VPAAEPNAIDVGVAGDIAAEHAPGPGSLQMLLLDALHTLDEATVRRRARIAEVP
jgi:hydroxyethylthiazole kinase